MVCGNVKTGCCFMVFMILWRHFYVVFHFEENDFAKYLYQPIMNLFVLGYLFRNTNVSPTVPETEVRCLFKWIKWKFNEGSTLILKYSKVKHRKKNVYNLGLQLGICHKMYFQKMCVVKTHEDSSSCFFLKPLIFSVIIKKIKIRLWYNVDNDKIFTTE